MEYFWSGHHDIPTPLFRCAICLMALLVVLVYAMSLSAFLSATNADEGGHTILTECGFTLMSAMFLHIIAYLISVVGGLFLCCAERCMLDHEIGRAHV